MKHVRFLLVLVALLAFTVPVFAQDSMTLGLSEEDFNLWTAANAASTSFDTLTYAFEASFNIEGEDAGSLTGEGVIGEGFTLSVTGELTAEGETIPAALDVVALGESVFFNLGGMGWYEVTGEDAEMLMGMAGDMGGVPFDPSALAEGDLSGMGMDADALAGMDPSELLAAFSAERLADEGELAHFALTIDLEALASTEAFQAGLEMGAESSGGMSSSDVEDMMAALAGATITVDQFINSGSGLVDRTVLTIAGSGTEIVFDLTFAYNEQVSIEAPSDAQPFQELMQMLMGGMGSM